MYEDLIAELREEAEWAKANEWETPIMLSDHLEQAADAIEELVGKVEQLPRWIPVTERLPEDGQWMLVWGNGYHIPIMMFRESGAWIDGQFEFHSTVTHWMPLPETPKEEE